jgi:hypothetical protein
MEKNCRSAGLFCSICGMTNNSPDTRSIAWVVCTVDGWVGGINHAPTSTLANTPAPASASIRSARSGAPPLVPLASNSGIGRQSCVPGGGRLPSTALLGGLPNPMMMKAQFSCGCSGNYGGSGDWVQDNCRRFCGSLDCPLIDCRVFFGGDVPPGGTLNVGSS